MKKTTLILWATLLLACCWTVDAQGHGMSMFAAHDGKNITGTAEYHAGVPVVDAEVLVEAGDKSGWWKTRTNQQGKFIIEVASHEKYLVIVDAGGGHISEAEVKASNPTSTSGVSDTQIIELRREIHELKTSIRFHDILGGIGYIFGLVGLALYLKKRR